MADTRWLRGPNKWAAPRAQDFVLNRLKETVHETVLPDTDDLQYGALADHLRNVLDAVLSRRAQAGDAR
eukprot:1785240-Prymnesium_polylepis.1